MRETGIVQAIEGGEALVKLRRHAACLGCRACSLSSSGDMTIKAIAQGEVKPGDEVTLEIDSASIVKAIALVYILPSIAFIVGVFAGLKIVSAYKHKEAISVLIGVGFLAASFFVARIYGKNRSNAYQARII